MRVLIFISGGGQPAGCPHAGHVAFVWKFRLEVFRLEVFGADPWLGHERGARAHAFAVHRPWCWVGTQA